MAFNRSAFSASKMNNEIKAQTTSLSEGKVSVSSGKKKKHQWFKLNGNISLFKNPEKAGKLVVNILPFLRKNGDVGFFDNVFVHMIPAVDGFGTENYLCTGRNCAVCKIKNERDDGNVEWDDIKAYIPKKRTGILVNPVGTDDVQFMEVASVNRGKALPEMISNQAIAMADGSSVVDFASIDEGQSVILVFGEQTFNSHKYTEVTSVAFRPRIEEISDEVLNKIPDYIEMLHNVGPNDNEEMETLINGGEVALSEEDKQADFEKSIKDSAPKSNPMDAFKVDKAVDFEDKPMPEGPLSKDDFKQNPMTAKPANKSTVECPFQFDIKTEYGCHRQCMKCQFADQCEKIAG